MTRSRCRGPAAHRAADAATIPCCRLITYAELGNSHEERGDAYRSLLAEVFSDDDLQAIRACLHQQRALGRDDS